MNLPDNSPSLRFPNDILLSNDENLQNQIYDGFMGPGEVDRDNRKKILVYTDSTLKEITIQLDPNGNGEIKERRVLATDNEELLSKSELVEDYNLRYQLYLDILDMKSYGPYEAQHLISTDNSIYGICMDVDERGIKSVNNYKTLLQTNELNLRTFNERKSGTVTNAAQYQRGLGSKLKYRGTTIFNGHQIIYDCEEGHVTNLEVGTKFDNLNDFLSNSNYEFLIETLDTLHDSMEHLHLNTVQFVDRDDESTAESVVNVLSDIAEIIPLRISIVEFPKDTDVIHETFFYYIMKFLDFCRNTSSIARDTNHDRAELIYDMMHSLTGQFTSFLNGQFFNSGGSKKQMEGLSPKEIEELMARNKTMRVHGHKIVMNTMLVLIGDVKKFFNTLGENLNRENITLGELLNEKERNINLTGRGIDNNTVRINYEDDNIKDLISRIKSPFLIPLVENLLSNSSKYGTNVIPELFGRCDSLPLIEVDVKLVNKNLVVIIRDVGKKSLETQEITIEPGFTTKTLTQISTEEDSTEPAAISHKSGLELITEQLIKLRGNLIVRNIDNPKEEGFSKEIILTVPINSLEVPK